MRVKPGYILFIPFVFLFHFLYAGGSYPEVKGRKDSLKPQQDTLSVVGVGDIMMGTNFPSTKYLNSKGCQVFFKEVENYLSDADITTGNLEGCLSDSAELVKRCKDTTKCYAFRMPAQYGECLKHNGFDFLSIANNHSHDFGIEGVKHTVETLDSLGIQYAGTPDYPYAIRTKDSITYGFCAFSPNKGTLSITDYDEAARIVKMLDDTSDVVIVSFHGGAEGNKHQRITRKTEYYYGEDRGNVHEFAHKVVDAGADLVFGHGPHVPRAIELYKERLICYSLGNFLTYGRFNLKGPNGIAPLIKVHVSVKGAFINGEIIPLKQYYSGKLIVDPARRATKLIKELTSKDFNESDLIINENGFIHK